jgi:Putative Ig domain
MGVCHFANSPMRRGVPVVLVLCLLTLLATGCGGGGAQSNPSPPPPPPPPPPPVITITTTSLPGGVAGVAYAATLAASGGTLPLKWDISSGLLPSGFSLSQDGVLSGTYPAFYGGCPNCSFTVRVIDSAVPSNIAVRNLSLDILGFWPTSLLTPQVGVDYQTGNFGVNGGTEPILWTLSGTSPPGFVFRKNPAAPDTREYQLAGIPSQSGHYQFSVSVSDSGSPIRSETINYQLDVEPAPLQLQRAMLPPGVVGQSYGYGFNLTGGAPRYSWTISGVQLPSGLQFDSVHGSLTGTPTLPGYASFSVTVDDSSTPNQQHTQQYYWLLVTPNALPPRNDSIANATPIYPGTYNASISPYADPPGTTSPDQDYYQMTAVAGTTIRVTAAAQDTGRVLVPSVLDPVVEIVDANGQRFNSCNDPDDDNPPPGVPIAQDSTPQGFDDPCMNHIGDPTNYVVKYSSLTFKVPGSSGNVTFYFHIFDFRGDARPDMFYTLTIQ